MIARFKFFLRCLNHWDRRGHWPKNPKVYAGYFLCEKCNRGTPQRNPFRVLTTKQAVRALSYG